MIGTMEDLITNTVALDSFFVFLFSPAYLVLRFALVYPCFSEITVALLGCFQYSIRTHCDADRIGAVLHFLYPVLSLSFCVFYDSVCYVYCIVHVLRMP